MARKQSEPDDVRERLAALEAAVGLISTGSDNYAQRLSDLDDRLTKLEKAVRANLGVTLD